MPDGLEGVDLMPYLSGANKEPPHSTLYWRFGPQKAIRDRNWKLVDARDMQAKTQTGWQLFDLDSDIGETKNLAAEKPWMVRDLAQKWTLNEKNVDPIWRGTVNEDPR